MGWKSDKTYDFTNIRQLMGEAGRQNPSASRMELAMMSLLGLMYDAANTQIATSTTTITNAADKLSASVDLITTQLEGLQNMSAEFDALTASVQSNTTVLESAIVLINGISARITAAGVDPAALTALTAELDAKDAELASAVTANTPSYP
jgi:hypothetical protein